MALIIALPLLAFTIAGLFVGRMLPPKTQRIIIITLSLLLAIAHFYLAGQQLSTTGFIARQRNPDYFAYYTGYGLAAAGLLNVAVCFKSRLVSGVLLAAMIVLLPVFYLATW
jgi:hypothetical protein